MRPPVVCLTMLALAAIPPRSAGQMPPQGATGSIAGLVRDAATNAGLPSANVALVGTRFTATTDAEGRYSIAAVPPGSYRVRARALGYAPAETTVVIQDGQ